jgi:hypothetical protein
VRQIQARHCSPDGDYVSLSDLKAKRPMELRKKARYATWNVVDQGW